MNPIMSIVATTYYPGTKQGQDRLAMALQCIESWQRGLMFTGQLDIHVCDDGSEHPLSVKGWDRGRVFYHQQARRGIGASLNTGFRSAFEASPLAMYLVDDWMLLEPIQVGPWMTLLETNNDIGMVRLGPPHPGITGKCIYWDQGWYWLLDRHDYCYAMRPAIFHKRFYDAYGWYNEKESCWKVERKYNEAFCRAPGPDVVLAVPNQWAHMDILPLGEVEFEEGKGE